jgi:hypothetical protein
LQPQVDQPGMRRKPSAIDAHGAPDTRIAWWAAFLVTLALLAILSLARSAQAVTFPTPAGALTAALTAADEEAEEEDEGDGGEADEGDEEGEFEAEECLPGEAEECEDEDASGAPQECLLQRAEATVSVSPKRDRVSLRVDYATAAPTTIGITYSLRGRKGSLALGAERKRIASNGVIRLTRTLSDAQMAKALAAKEFTVRLAVAAAPSHCRAYFERHLDLRRATAGGLSWQQSE